MGRSLGMGTLEVLAALERRVGYGLDLAQHTGLLQGSVYTTLRRLERRGLVRGDWEDPEVAEAERRPRRRYYTLTSDGREALERGRERFRRIGIGVRARRPGARPAPEVPE